MEVFELNNSSTFLVTFGSGREWRPAVKRLTSQAVKTRRFGKIVTFSEADLDVNALDVDRDFFLDNPRGYGFWIWKPFIILKVLENFPECEVVFYLDSGCEINAEKSALQKLDQYIATCSQKGGVAFELPFIEENWTAGYVLDKMDAKNLSRTKQLASGIIFLKNNHRSKDLLTSWQTWMTKDNCTYVKGDKANIENKVSLREHRFDQSIFSILWKQANLQILPDESFWAPDWKNFGKDYPIWSTRSKLRFSFSVNRILFFCYRASRYFLRKVSRDKLFI